MFLPRLSRYLCDFRLEAFPLVFQTNLGRVPSRFTCRRLRLHRAFEFISLLAQIGNALLGFDAGIGFHRRSLAFERRQGGIHLVDPLFGPTQKKVNTALRGHDSVSIAQLCIEGLFLPAQLSGFCMISNVRDGRNRPILDLNHCIAS